MRDNGSTICVLRHSLARSHDFTGSQRKVLLLNSAPVFAPEMKIKIKSPYYTGWINAVTLETPLYDLVIGNIPGATNGASKDVVTQTCNAALTSEDFRECEDEGLLGEVQIGAAVVTRAAAKRKTTVKLLVVKSHGDLTNSEELRKEVDSNPTLQGSRKRLQGNCVLRVKNDQVCFIKQRGLIYRQVISPSGERKLQLVVPAKYSDAALQLGHSTTLGHMGRA